MGLQNSKDSWMQILWSKTVTVSCSNNYFMRTFDSSYEDKGEQKSIHLIGISFIVIHSIFDILFVNVISGLNMHEIPPPPPFPFFCSLRQYASEVYIWNLFTGKCNFKFGLLKFFIYLNMLLIWKLPWVLMFNITKNITLQLH